MSDTMTLSVPQTDSEYEAAFQQLLADMSTSEERMDKSRASSERLKMESAIIRAETKIIKADIEANLIRLQELINQLSKAA